MATVTTSRPTLRPPAARPRRRWRWVRWVVAVLVVAALGALTWLVGFSTVLAVKRVTVSESGDLLTAQQVRDAASVPVGVPLVRQDLDAIAGRVAALPPVALVRVERRWPDAVTIQVTERTPALAVPQPTGYALVDRSGVAYASVDRRSDGLVLARVDPSNQRLLQKMAEVAGLLPNQLRNQVGVIRAESVNTISLELESGVRVMWGPADDTALKAQVALALLKQKPRQIDVSAPHQPAVR